MMKMLASVGMLCRRRACPETLLEVNNPLKLLIRGRPYQQRTVSTLSPLAAAFNSRQVRKLNLSLLKESTGLFRIPVLQESDGFYTLKEKAITETEELIQEACSDSRERKMVEVFDSLSDCLCQVADLAEFIRVAHPKGKFAFAAEDACVTISGLVERLNTHQELFHCLKSVVDNGDKFPTTAVDDHVARLFLFDFEQSGIHLGQNERKKVVHLNEQILHYGQYFAANAQLPRAIPKSQLPENIRHHFATDGDNILVTGLFSDSEDDLAREVAHKIYLFPDADQESRLDQLLQLRYELASLCGFPTYSHRATQNSLAGTPEMVQSILDSLSCTLKPWAEEDFCIMTLLKKEKNKYAKDLAIWDTHYFTSLAKANWFGINSCDVAPYLSLGRCMEGLNLLFQSLYDISLLNEVPEDREVWAEDVYKVAVVHNTTGLLGHIYCDFYTRAHKPQQDCHFTIRGGRMRQDGTYQNPIVVLMLNFPPPTWTMPSLLTPGMVENLFHEMGHAMHSMLARTQYQHVTGTRCTTDFAEVPSVLMEYFATDPRVLSTFAYHYKTGEPIPSDVLYRMCAAKNIFTASEMQLQVFYSALDQRYHSTYPLRKTTTEVLADVQEQYYGLPYVPDTAWQLRFNHLVGYGAKYYSYILSRVVASWIWQQCFQEDPFNPVMGEKYYHECLAHGGGKPAKELVSQFLGREVTVDNLTQSFVNELEYRKSTVKQWKR